MVEAQSLSSPLAGLRVIELCQYVAGPYAGLILAQLGAQVTKVERPGRGDDTRYWGPPYWGDKSVMFTGMNAGKSSMSLDLAHHGDQGQLRQIVAEADIVLASWRPGALERLGFGYADVAEINPAIVYCTISGFGHAGPLAEQQGYDALAQAFTGMMSVTGEPGAAPVRVGTSAIDMGAGMWAALAVVTAIHERSLTGEGKHVTTSLYETGLAWLPYQVAGYLATGDEPQPMGSGLAMIVPYGAFPTSDRYFVVGAGNDAAWRRLCSALERDDLASDSELATNTQRVERREQVSQASTAVFHGP